jgi:kynurenine formamidase
MRDQNMSRRLIDLSHPLEPATPLWPGNPPTEFSILATIPAERGPTDRGIGGEAVMCNHSAFLTCNHTGTHMDAPAHFYNGVRTIEQVPLEQFIGAAALVDVRKVGPRGEITPTDFAKCEAAIKATRKVIFWTGWSSRWGQDGYFDDYPVLSEATGSWLVERGVHLVGMDTPSPDCDPHTVHYILLGANMVIVENLRGLEQIGRDVFELIVVPLPLKGLEASPVRAIAALPVADSG